MSKKILLREVLLLSSVYINAALMGCSTVWLVYSGLYLRQPNHRPHATTQQLGHILSLTEIGEIMVVIPGSFLAEIFGRKPLIMVIGSLNLLSWFFLAMFPSIEVIYISRCAYGVAHGLLQVVAYPVIGEIASPKYRALLSNIYSFAKIFGALYSSILNSLFQSYQLIQICGAATALLFIPTVYWLTETPEHLIQTKKYEKARKNLKILRPQYSEAELNAEFNAIRKNVGDKDTDPSKADWKRFLKMKSVPKSLIYISVVNAATLLSGLPIISNYMTTIMPANCYVAQSWYPLIDVVTRTLILVAFSAIIEAFPRRLLYLSCSTFLIVALALATVSNFINTYSPAEHWKWIFLADNFIFLKVFALIDILNGTSRSELFPSGLKGFGNAVCSIVRSVTVICAAQIYSWIVNHSYLYIQYIMFTSMSTCLTITAYFYLPETRGKTLAEIQTALESDKTDISKTKEGGVTEELFLMTDK